MDHLLAASTAFANAMYHTRKLGLRERRIFVESMHARLAIVEDSIRQEVLAVEVRRSVVKVGEDGSRLIRTS